MELPFFYISEYTPSGEELVLDEDNSRHIVQVLRMHAGERLQLTDGKGNLLTASIVDPHKKKCRVKIADALFVPAREHKVTIAISLVKNASRFEWFLEKATEMGVSHIIPLVSERTERQHFRQDRMQQIVISAMLQSQQCWLPQLDEPMAVDVLVREMARVGGDDAGAVVGVDDAHGMAAADGAQTLDGRASEGRFIAHCIESERVSLAGLVREGKAGAAAGAGSSLILIGPEGDFSQKEIDAAMAAGFGAVLLGETRLRTETAGVVAAALLCVH